MFPPVEAWSVIGWETSVANFVHQLLLGPGLWFSAHLVHVLSLGTKDQAEHVQAPKYFPKFFIFFH